MEEYRKQTMLWPKAPLVCAKAIANEDRTTRKVMCFQFELGWFFTTFKVDNFIT